MQQQSMLNYELEFNMIMISKKYAYYLVSLTLLFLMGCTISSDNISPLLPVEENLENIDWRAAKEKNTIDGYNAYLEKYGNDALYSVTAQRNIKNILWDETVRSNTIENYQEFLKIYNKNDRYGKDALAKIEDLEYIKRKKENTIEGYDWYLDNYCDFGVCRHEEDVKEEVKKILSISSIVISLNLDSEFKRDIKNFDSTITSEKIEEFCRKDFITKIKKLGIYNPNKNGLILQINLQMDYGNWKTVSTQNFKPVARGVYIISDGDIIFPISNRRLSSLAYFKGGWSEELTISQWKYLTESVKFHSNTILNNLKKLKENN